MSKRFTDSTKWNKQWIRNLDLRHKLFWLYLLDKCDHAGIWDVDLGLAGFQIGAEFDRGEVLTIFGPQIIELEGGTKWFIPKFIEFQYGTLNPEVKAHLSAIKILIRHNIDPESLTVSQQLINYSLPLMVKDKDKDKVKDKYSADFIEFWTAYPRKIGKGAALKAWKKAKLPAMAVILNAVEDQKKSRQWQKDSGQYIPHPSTWINQERWEDEITEGAPRDLDPQHTEKF